MSNPLQTFRDILTGKGLIPPDIEADGRLHRCPTQTRQHKQNGAYIAHIDLPATLWWCNWETGDQGTFTETEQRTFSPVEQEAWQKRQRDIRRQREAECARRYETAAKQAQELLNASVSCSPEHAYLRRKGVPALADIRQTRSGLLILPVRDISGNMQSLQYCNTSLRTEQSAFSWAEKYKEDISLSPASRTPLVLCEGYATGASIHLAVNYRICDVLSQ